MIIFTEKTVPAYLVRGTCRIVFYCHYCRCIHSHSDYGRGVKGGGYRKSHCSGIKSPLYMHDYFLDVLGSVASENDLVPKGPVEFFRRANKITRPDIFRFELVPAYLVSGARQIVYWCDWCRRNHRHGDAVKGLKGGGYRACHCYNDDNPLYRQDIYLDVLGQVECEKDLLPRNKTRLNRKKCIVAGVSKRRLQ